MEVEAAYSNSCYNTRCLLKCNDPSFLKITLTIFMTIRDFSISTNIVLVLVHCVCG